jgi:hypothetical protein
MPHNQSSTVAPVHPNEQFDMVTDKRSKYMRMLFLLDTYILFFAAERADNL